MKYEQGRYRVKITAAALGESKSGNAQVELVIQPIGKYEGYDCLGFDAEACPARKVYLTLTEGTIGNAQSPGWVWQTLVDLGFCGQSFEDLAPLVGKVRDAECVHEQKMNGEGEYEKWSIWRSWDMKPVKPAEKSLVRKVNTQFAGLLKTMKQTGQQMAKHDHDQGAPVTVPEDDIPF